MSFLAKTAFKKNHNIDMTEGSVIKHIITFAFPLMIGNLFQQLYNMVDIWVIGKTGLNGENSHVIEYSLKLDSNPEFTSSVLVAYARAAVKMSKEGLCGCKTAFDVAPTYLSPCTGEELRKRLL